MYVHITMLFPISYGLGLPVASLTTRHCQSMRVVMSELAVMSVKISLMQIVRDAGGMR